MNARWVLLVIVLTIALLAWRPSTKLTVQKPSNISLSMPPPGIPMDLARIMQKCVDIAVPELLEPVRDQPYTDLEIRGAVTPLLEKARTHGAALTPIGNAHSASKVVDSNKMVRYVARMSFHESKSDVTVLLDVVLLVTATQTYVESVKFATPIATAKPDELASMASTDEQPRAKFVDPMTLFETQKVLL